MEVAWIVLGLAYTLVSNWSRNTEIFLNEALKELVRRQDLHTGLLYHLGTNHPRRRFPNFATQIYGVLALAVVADLGLSDQTLNLAKRTATA